MKEQKRKDEQERQGTVPISDNPGEYKVKSESGCGERTRRLWHTGVLLGITEPEQQRSNKVNRVGNPR